MKFKIKNRPYLLNEILEFSADLKNDNDLLVIHGVDRLGEEDKIKYHLPIGKHPLIYKKSNLKAAPTPENRNSGNVKSGQHEKSINYMVSKFCESAI